MVLGALIVQTCFSGTLQRTFWDFCESFGCWNARILGPSGPSAHGALFRSGGPETLREGCAPCPPPPLATSLVQCSLFTVFGVHARAEFPIHLDQFWLLPHQPHGLPHQFLIDFGAFWLRVSSKWSSWHRLYHIRCLIFQTLKRLIFTMLALQPSSNITVCPTNFSKEDSPVCSRC